MKETDKETEENSERQKGMAGKMERKTKNTEKSEKNNGPRWNMRVSAYGAVGISFGWFKWQDLEWQWLFLTFDFSRIAPLPNFIQNR